MRRSISTPEHDAFRDAIRQFLVKEVVPDYPAWEKAGAPPRDFYRGAGELGFIGIQVPEKFGGGGEPTFTYNAILTEESQRACVGLGSLRVHMDVVLPYFLHYANAEQKRRWLPRIASGELMTAIAMTQPGTGSDPARIPTTATRDREH